MPQWDLVGQSAISGEKIPFAVRWAPERQNLNSFIDLGFVPDYQACKLKSRLRELPWLSALPAAWLLWMQQKQEMSSLNLNLSLKAC